MSDAIKYISKVEIKGLWGRFDLTWNLNEDVNVLSGINGSGKTTILKCIYTLIANNRYPNQNWDDIDEVGNHIAECKIIFNEYDYISCRFLKKEKGISQGFTLDEARRQRYSASKHHIYIYSKNSYSPFNLPLFDLICTFDIALKPAESIKKLSDDFGKTGLDWELYQLQKKYIKYKLSLANKTIEAIGKNITNGDLIKIQENQNKFIEIIDTNFEETGKKIDRKEDELNFLSGEEKLTAYQLSSGEKQLLIILLTVLVQDNKNAILFMDEPELSLHFDWQKKLIGYIRELNPNVQVILSTHSPAMIMEGWRDKVSEVSDLITADYKAGIHAAK